MEMLGTDGEPRRDSGSAVCARLLLMSEFTVQELTDRLAAASDQLFALPGIVGTGVGGHPSSPTIHIFVSPDTPASSIELAGELLDGLPLEILGMSVPAANDGSGGTENEQTDC